MARTMLTPVLEGRVASPNGSPMNAIEHLMDEHRTLEGILGAMETWAESLDARTDGENGRQLGFFATFLRDYVDPVHHQKEERVLFEALIEHGFPRDIGPVAAMQREHDECRALVRRMTSLADSAHEWTADDKESLRGVVFGYIEHLSHHIFKEDNVLYPVAVSQLPAERLARMVVEFEAMDAAAGRASLLAQAASLWQPPPYSAPAHAL